jgi:hypothetical protein
VRRLVLAATLPIVSPGFPRRAEYWLGVKAQGNHDVASKRQAAWSTRAARAARLASDAASFALTRAHRRTLAEGCLRRS